MTAQTTRAILFAMATLATRTGFLASNATSRGSAVSGLYLARRINDVAPTTNSFLRYRSPILVMRPSRPPQPSCGASANSSLSYLTCSPTGRGTVRYRDMRHPYPDDDRPLDYVDFSMTALVAAALGIVILAVIKLTHPL